jgi:hypothetical protein
VSPSRDEADEDEDEVVAGKTLGTDADDVKRRLPSTLDARIGVPSVLQGNTNRCARIVLPQHEKHKRNIRQKDTI